MALSCSCCSSSRGDGESPEVLKQMATNGLIHDSYMNWVEEGTDTLGSKVGVANTCTAILLVETASCLSLSILNNH